MIRVGILDLGLRRSGESPQQAVAETIELACMAEELGYARYWLAEHHDSRVAWASPEIVVPLIAASTKRIRVGPAGILLLVYNPLKVANDFSLLSHLFPDRIDLGLARGWPGRNGEALLGAPPSSVTEADYAQKIAELVGYLSDSRPASSRHPESRAYPYPPGRPRIWLLGEGRVSGELAVQHQLSLGYAAYDPARIDCEMLRSFVTRLERDGPGRVTLAVAVVCAATQERAAELAGSLLNMRPDRSPTVIGTPERCWRQLIELAERFGVRDFTVVDLCSRRKDTVSSLRLLATYGGEAMGSSGD